MTHKCDGCRYKGEHQEQGFVPFGVCLKETNLIKAEQSYKAECCPYIVDTYAEGTAEELQEVIDDITAIIGTESYQKAVETIQWSVRGMIESLNAIHAQILDYPNKKVLHLALYHPKERVRKKNLHRIKKWIEKGK